MSRPRTTSSVKQLYITTVKLVWHTATLQKDINSFGRATYLNSG